MSESAADELEAICRAAAAPRRGRAGRPGGGAGRSEGEVASRQPEPAGRKRTPPALPPTTPKRRHAAASPDAAKALLAQTEAAPRRASKRASAEDTPAKPAAKAARAPPPGEDSPPREGRRPQKAAAAKAPAAAGAPPSLGCSRCRLSANGCLQCNPNHPRYAGGDEAQEAAPSRKAAAAKRAPATSTPRRPASQTAATQAPAARPAPVAARAAPSKPLAGSSGLRCRSCDAPGAQRREASNGGALCRACYGRWIAREYCPVCERLWSDVGDDACMLQCDSCDCWVHARCERLSPASVAQWCDLCYSCPSCRDAAPGEQLPAPPRSAAVRPCFSCQAAPAVGEVEVPEHGAVPLCGHCQARWEGREYCPVCNQLWKEAADDDDEGGAEEDMVQCDACSLWVHTACESMAPDEVALLEDCVYHCSACRRAPARSAAGTAAGAVGAFDFKGKARAEVSGARLTVWYEEEVGDQAVDVPYSGMVKRFDPRDGLYVKFAGFPEEFLITNEDDWQWGSLSCGAARDADSDLAAALSATAAAPPPPPQQQPVAAGAGAAAPGLVFTAPASAPAVAMPPAFAAQLAVQWPLPPSARFAAPQPNPLLHHQTFGGAPPYAAPTWGRPGSGTIEPLGQSQPQPPLQMRPMPPPLPMQPFQPPLPSHAAPAAPPPPQPTSCMIVSPSAQPARPAACTAACTAVTALPSGTVTAAAAPAAAPVTPSASTSSSFDPALAERYKSHAVRFEPLTAANVESKMRGLCEGLEKVYGSMPFARKEWGTSILGTLVGLICAQTCRNSWSSIGYANFQATFPGPNGEPDWDLVRRSRVEALEPCIQHGPYYHTKAERIHGLLQKAYEDFGAGTSFEALHTWPSEKVRSYLMAISGLSGKSIACLLLYRMNRLSFAVDANVLRMMTRLGWLKSLGIMPVEGLAIGDRRVVARIGLLPAPPPRRAPAAAAATARRDSSTDVVAVGIAVERESGRVVLRLQPIPMPVRLQLCAKQPKPPRPALTFRPSGAGTKKRRCGACAACLSPNCGQCSKCRDMPAFGGPGKMRQCCERRHCVAPLQPASALPAPEAPQTSVERSSQLPVQPPLPNQPQVAMMPQPQPPPPPWGLPVGWSLPLPQLVMPIAHAGAPALLPAPAHRSWPQAPPHAQLQAMAGMLQQPFLPAPTPPASPPPCDPLEDVTMDTAEGGATDEAEESISGGTADAAEVAMDLAEGSIVDLTEEGEEGAMDAMEACEMGVDDRVLVRDVIAEAIGRLPSAPGVPSATRKPGVPLAFGFSPYDVSGEIGPEEPPQQVVDSLVPRPVPLSEDQPISTSALAAAAAAVAPPPQTRSSPPPFRRV